MDLARTLAARPAKRHHIHLPVAVATTGPMTQQRRQELADRLYAEHIYKTDYIRGEIGLQAVLPIGYGILTWIFGDALWSGSAVYRTALSAPGAPQSWGTLFVVLGVGLMVCALRHRYRLVAGSAAVTALVLSLFMVMFLTEYFTTANESALPPALAWAVFSLLLLNLSRLALKMGALVRQFGGEQYPGAGGG